MMGGSLAWKLERMSWAAFLVSGVAILGGCQGPTCESACTKAFDSCALDLNNNSNDLETNIANCTFACRAGMDGAAQEAKAVGWIGCVESYACNVVDEGIPLCLECQAGYYLGYETGSACNYAESID